MRLTAGDLARLTDGEVVSGDPATVVEEFVIDTRCMTADVCFVALQGNRDGHDFVGDAFTRGATAALVARVPDHLASAHTVVKVADPQHALSAVAAVARRELWDATVVGITGSTGKTSTKDLAAAAIGRARSVHASPASFNNEVGLPLTLLGAPSGTEVIVCEMGARFPGNVRELCAVAQPNIGVVTNLGLAHAEHLGGIVGTLAVKAELLEALSSDGLAVLNAEDPGSGALRTRTRARVLAVGRVPGSDGEILIGDVRLDAGLRPTFLLETPWGKGEVHLGVRGEHQVLNAGLAAGVALSVGVSFADVQAGLADARGCEGRMQLERSPGGITVLNDAYNANPASTRAALHALAQLPIDGKRVAVLGEMRELGDYARDAHRDIGRVAVESGVASLIVVGKSAREVASGARDARGGNGLPEILEVDDAAGVLDALAARLRPGDAVLVKASRAVGLEHVADPIIRGALDGART